MGEASNGRGPRAPGLRVPAEPPGPRARRTVLVALSLPLDLGALEREPVSRHHGQAPHTGKSRFCKCFYVTHLFKNKQTKKHLLVRLASGLEA